MCQCRPIHSQIGGMWVIAGRRATSLYHEYAMYSADTQDEDREEPSSMQVTDGVAVVIGCGPVSPSPYY